MRSPRIRPTLTRTRILGALVLVAVAVAAFQFSNLISGLIGPNPQTAPWRLIKSMELVDAGRPFNATLIARSGSLFVAAGNNQKSIDMWYSTDGRKWLRGTSPDLTPPSGRTYEVRDLVATEDKIVAIGVENDADSFTRLMAWESRNGTTWWRDTSFPESVPNEFLMVGNAVEHSGSIYFETTFGFLRNDPESTGWHYVKSARQCTQEFGGSTELGPMLLGGCVKEGEGEASIPVRAVATAVDPTGRQTDYGPRTGLDWAAGAASTDGVTVVVGIRHTSPTAVFTRSLDHGTTWSELQRFPIPADIDAADIKNLVSADGILIAAGEVLGSGAVPLPAVWTSVDGGESWAFHRLPGLGVNGWIREITAKDGRIVAPAKTGYGPVEVAGMMVNFE